MATESSAAATDVLVVGAGPIGLTAALELRRRGVACRVVDKLTEPPQYAKAVGVQARTLELWEAAGVLPAMLDAAIPMFGQFVYRNGERVATMQFELPPDMPYGFMALPQYETERLLREALARHGVVPERGVELVSFTQDDDGVTAELVGPGGPETVRAAYLVGGDGAHSTVRKVLGLSFEGGAFAEEYMLGDVEVDWSIPRGYGVRAMREEDGTVVDLLVCIPLPGRGRYRMSMLVPPELSSAAPAAGEVAHGFEAGRAPELHHIQAVIDRMSPEPTVARNLRWSSVFRISHRIAGAYSAGRAFIAGDAAHIHPPTGAQGMNTGIQDAVNLAWKLAAAVHGTAAPGLLDSYDAERRPVGEEVVGRTVQAATTGVRFDAADPFAAVRREAQLLVGYRGSPIVGEVDESLPAGAPQAGDRAPDARGLVRDIVQFPVRLFELFRVPGHALLLYADTDTTAAGLDEVADAARSVLGDDLVVHAVLASGVHAPRLVTPTLRDAAGEFRAAYAAVDGTLLAVRPDGYVGHRGSVADPAGLLRYAAGVVAPAGERVGVGR
ncbi:Pentachlorophenol monooxygenase [Pseudonocardia dioxanivorans CB1190]|uniref:Pentachlorophenol monooxygenase n=1 Tax=Pseudonocardia dioxanivorans (strain ATCC 55486 / DSM 44775 / JCM 13855 / CB1190) TaxID=675635 RepID=F4CNU0_PSEUX|nr:FAD-dependent monooxygenase [Pseudonocardia dioxanivorans]AEA22552.1 Pentachlorophenol monooxygenase [Pseudonocardia dioxanivorans CB1190]